jgi:methylmalonyl-CoA mutase C-terminal domain/subunit
MLGAVSQHCLLVFVAKFGYKDCVAPPARRPEGRAGCPADSQQGAGATGLTFLLYPRAFADPRWLRSHTQMPAEQKIRVLVAKPGLDGHDRGAKVIARALRDAGMEVIYTGLRQTPEMIVNAAVQEDVHVIGLSILSGAHNAIVPRVMDLLKQNKMDDVIVVVGGIIPDQDVAHLKKIGVAAIFQPGTAMDAIVQFIRANIKPRSVPTAG